MDERRTQIEGQVALVTGANRGIGRAIAEELLRRGAAKVYSGVRTPGSTVADQSQALAVDVTDRTGVDAAAVTAPDVTLLVNNAGIDNAQDLVTGDPSRMRDEIETNVFGTLAMIRAFAPILDRNGGGGIINILSGASWMPFPGHASYAMSKAAAWSLTTAVRMELAPQRTLVTGVHVGLVDTDFTAGIEMDKLSPVTFARITLDGFEQGLEEVIADDVAARIKRALAQPPGSLSL